MSENEMNALKNRLTALLLAASDMDQAATAARALREESEDHNLMRALETAIVVCYARAFTQSSLFRLSRTEYEPSDSRLADIHHTLYALRDSVYAHTDRESGRSASIRLVNEIGGTDPATIPAAREFLRSEGWLPLNREALPTILELLRVQSETFYAEAVRIHSRLKGLAT